MRIEINSKEEFKTLVKDKPQNASLIFLNHFERWYRRDSYRILTIETNIDNDLSEIISSVKRKNLEIIFFDQEKNYESGILTSRLHIRLFHQGITDKLSHEIIESLEREKFDIRRITWNHS